MNLGQEEVPHLSSRGVVFGFYELHHIQNVLWSWATERHTVVGCIEKMAIRLNKKESGFGEDFGLFFVDAARHVKTPVFHIFLTQTVADSELLQRPLVSRSFGSLSTVCTGSDQLDAQIVELVL